jgi:hypothetical protein
MESEVILLSLKLGKHNYDITDKSRFFCNASTVQLLDQKTKEPPVLKAKHLKQINKFERVQHKHEFGHTISIFSLRKFNEE